MIQDLDLAEDVGPPAVDGGADFVEEVVSGFQQPGCVPGAAVEDEVCCGEGGRPDDAHGLVGSNCTKGSRFGEDDALDERLVLLESCHELCAETASQSRDDLKLCKE